MGKSWTKDLKPVKGHEAAYNFDGKTAVKVSSKALLTKTWEMIPSSVT